MKTEDLIVANIKCGGCVATIQKELINMEGMVSATVDKENHTVSVTYDAIDRQSIIAKLASLGYPEATEKNGLLMQLKSISSCMTGKINQLN